MHTLGAIVYNLTLATALYAALMAVFAARGRRHNQLAQARSALELTLLGLAIAVVVLLYLLVTADFAVVYVAEHVNGQLPLFYRFTALWAGQAGSMLWWNFLMVFFAWLAARHVRQHAPQLEPWLIAILMAIAAFFTAIGCFSPSSDPFRVFAQGEKLFAQPEGRGLNPLLQHWAMIIHPPILYLGYVSFAIPFAIAMAALLSGELSPVWVRLVRRWTIFSWSFLGTGILLGGKWAYEELGWGGYWAWDPVENASLMPWLSATAFLHSVIVEERRGMLRVWNMVLVSVSFIMTIVGTALTRSGVVQSVHAFAQSNLGWFFLGLIVLLVIFCITLIIYRLPHLRSAPPIESLLSREVGFLFNNVFLLSALFIVLFGTLYPTLSEAIAGRRESVTAEWFNQFMAPLGILILFLTGLGPLLSWRRTEPRVLWRNLRLPLACAVVAIILAWFLLRSRIGGSVPQFLAITTFGVAAFVVAGVLAEWLAAAYAQYRFNQENFALAMLVVLFRNKRRFLGYMVHVALAILFCGFAGLAFAEETRLLLRPGEAESFGEYTIHVENYRETLMPQEATTPLYATRMVSLAVYKRNRLIGRDTTEIRSYPMYNFREGNYDRQNTSEPAIISTWFADIYLQLGGEEAGRLVLQLWINPLVRWVWAGFAFFVVMGLLLLLPVGEKKFAARNNLVQRPHDATATG
ncbi:MAG: heme lyase CcmF/NrfE family subunit [Turneriella sp.]|nr:heme lyase CcmF/NrfE family subunit [Turneriella sp.]